MSVFQISKPTQAQIVSSVELAVRVFVVAALGVLLVAKDPFSKATAIAAGLAGLTAVYGALRSTLTTL